MTDEIARGSLVRVTQRSESGDTDIDPQAAVVGAEYIVYDFLPEGEGDDPNGRAYYMLDTEHSFGGVHWAYPEHIEVVMTPEQLDARELPTGHDVAVAVARALHHGSDDFEIDETEVLDDYSYITAYGRTPEGLRFGLQVDVVSVWRTDL